MFETWGIVSIDQLVSLGLGKILLGNVRYRKDSCSAQMATQLADLLADLLGQLAIWGLQQSPPSDVAGWHTRNLEVKLSRLAHLSKSQWDQFQRCHLLWDRIRQWIDAPRTSWIAAPDCALGYSVHRRCSASARD